MNQIFTKFPNVSKNVRPLLSWIVSAKAASAAVAQTLIWRFSLTFLNLLNGVMVARSLGPLGRGEQASITLWPQILPSILEAGIPFSLVYFARSRPEQRQAYYGASLILACVCAIAAYFAGVIGVPHWLGKYDAHTIMLARMFMIFAPMSMLAYFVAAIIDAEFAFTLSNTLRFAPTVLTTLALATLVVTHSAQPATTAIAYLLPNAIAVVIIGSITLLRYKPILQNFISTSKDLIVYGAKIYVNTLLGTFGAQIDQLLVVGLLQPAQLGIYTVALSASRVLSIVSSSITNILLPKIVGRPPDEVASLVGTISRLTIAATAVLALPLALLMPILLPLFYGSAFKAGSTVAETLIVEAILSSAISIHSQTYLAMNRPSVITIFQVIGLALAVPLMLVLIPRIGLEGAALALLLSTCSRYISATLGYAFILKLPIPSILPRRSDIAFLLSAVRRRQEPGIEASSVA